MKKNLFSVLFLLFISFILTAQELTENAELPAMDMPESELLLTAPYESKDFYGKDDLLAFSEFESEVIEISKSEDKKVSDYSLGNRVNRRFFDQDYRLVKSEFWEIANYNDSKITKTEKF